MLCTGTRLSGKCVNQELCTRNVSGVCALLVVMVVQPVSLAVKNEPDAPSIEAISLADKAGEAAPSLS
jgi:hypothetical protein